jgi:ornithine cyclodeaminase/alanine dehydrogenase-like protein (mu-crystallin family)
MWFARERVRTQDWKWPTEAASKSAERLKDLLDGAFRDVSNEKGIVAGASCVLGTTKMRPPPAFPRVAGN